MQERELGRSGVGILIAEDDALVAAALQMVLSHAGYAVQVAGDGRAALERWRGVGERGFALLLTDLHMPEMDGAELARHIRRAEPEARIVMMSADPDGMHRRLREEGVQAQTLLKPASLADLLGVVQESLSWNGGCCQDGEAAQGRGVSTETERTLQSDWSLRRVRRTQSP